MSASIKPETFITLDESSVSFFVCHGKTSSSFENIIAVLGISRENEFLTNIFPLTYITADRAFCDNYSIAGTINSLSNLQNFFKIRGNLSVVHQMLLKARSRVQKQYGSLLRSIGATLNHYISKIKISSKLQDSFRSLFALNGNNGENMNSINVSPETYITLNRSNVAFYSSRGKIILNHKNKFSITGLTKFNAKILQISPETYITLNRLSDFYLLYKGRVESRTCLQTLLAIKSRIKFFGKWFFLYSCQVLQRNFDEIGAIGSLLRISKHNFTAISESKFGLSSKIKVTGFNISKYLDLIRLHGHSGGSKKRIQPIAGFIFSKKYLQIKSISVLFAKNSFAIRTLGRIKQKFQNSILIRAISPLAKTHVLRIIANCSVSFSKFSSVFGIARRINSKNLISDGVIAKTTKEYLPVCGSVTQTLSRFIKETGNIPKRIQKYFSNIGNSVAKNRSFQSIIGEIVTKRQGIFKTNSILDRIIEKILRISGLVYANRRNNFAVKGSIGILTKNVLDLVGFVRGRINSIFAVESRFETDNEFNFFEVVGNIRGQMYIESSYNRDQKFYQGQRWFR